MDCKTNCCISRYIAPLFFVSFVLFAQFVLVNIVIAVLMKHLRVPQEKYKRSTKRYNGSKEKRNDRVGQREITKEAVRRCSSK